jgi:hypothetical protein
MKARDDRLGWFRVDTDLHRHPKTHALADANGWTVREAVGVLFELWSWVAEFRIDGSLSDGDLSAMRRQGVAVDALLAAAFIERTNGSGYRARNWMDYNGYAIREALRKRARPARAARAESAPTGRDGTETLRKENLESESKSTPLLKVADEREVGQQSLDPNDPDRIETPREWAAGFDGFWEDYPRKTSKQDALRAYMKLAPRSQRTYDALFAGLAYWKRNEWRERAPDKIEYCATWLNAGRFRDAEEAANVR